MPCAPATNGLSSTALQKHTSFAQPSPPRSAVRAAAASTISLKRFTASMLIPARVLASETDEHTWSVTASASGIDSNSARSQFVKPLCT